MTLVGDGALLSAERFAGRLPGLAVAPEHLRNQRAGAMAPLAARLFAEGQTFPAGDLVPRYLRLPQAERELKLKQQKGE